MPPFSTAPSDHPGLGRSVFFTTIGNIALWKSLWELIDLNGVRSILFLATLPLLLFCLFNLMLTPLLALPFVRKPLLVLLVVVSAGCSYFMLHYNVLIDRSMVQNVFETNQAELNAYLSLPLLLTLLALGVLPAAGLALVRTASGAGSIRSLLVWPANVLASLVMLLVIGFAFYKDYSSLLRNNRYIRDQVLPLNVMRHTHGYLKASTAPASNRCARSARTRGAFRAHARSWWSWSSARPRGHRTSSSTATHAQPIPGSHARKASSASVMSPRAEPQRPSRCRACSRR